MHYYLDTNALYNAKKIPEMLLCKCFYSVLSLVEIVAGIDEKEFNARCSTLKFLTDKVDIIRCDYSFPETRIVSAFEYFNKSVFIQDKTTDLVDIITDIISSRSFSEFYSKTNARKLRYDFSSFVQLDNYYSSSFVETTVRGNEVLTEILNNSEIDKFIDFGGVRYDLSTKRKVGEFLDLPGINSSFALLACVNAAIQTMKIDNNNENQEKVFNTYNGALEIYLKGFSEYTKDKTVQNSQPAKNDAQDLIHLLYLHGGGVKIISNDNIYMKYITENSQTLNEFIYPSKK